MSVAAMTWVMGLSRPGASGKSTVRGSARLVLLELANAADEQGFAAVSVRWVGDRVGLNKDTVMKMLAALVAGGYLQLVETAQGRGRATVYRLALHRQPTAVVESRRRGDDAEEPPTSEPASAPTWPPAAPAPPGPVVSLPAARELGSRGPRRCRAGQGVGLAATLDSVVERLDAVTALARAAWVAQMPGQAGSDALRVLFELGPSASSGPQRIQVEALAAATALTPLRVRAALVLLAERGLVSPLAGGARSAAGRG